MNNREKKKKGTVLFVLTKKCFFYIQKMMKFYTQKIDELGGKLYYNHFLLNACNLIYTQKMFSSIDNLITKIFVKEMYINLEKG